MFVYFNFGTISALMRPSSSTSNAYDGGLPHISHVSLSICLSIIIHARYIVLNSWIFTDQSVYNCIWFINNVIILFCYYCMILNLKMWKKNNFKLQTKVIARYTKYIERRKKLGIERHPLKSPASKLIILRTWRTKLYNNLNQAHLKMKRIGCLDVKRKCSEFTGLL